MAKKVVDSMKQEGGVKFAKVIKMVKSPKTGCYQFKEKIVPIDEVKEYLEEKE